MMKVKNCVWIVTNVCIYALFFYIEEVGYRTFMANKLLLFASLVVLIVNMYCYFALKNENNLYKQSGIILYIFIILFFVLEISFTSFMNDYGILLITMYGILDAFLLNPFNHKED